MTEETKLIEAVIDTAIEVDGKKKMPCAKAFALARRLDTSIRRIGDICNAQDIKICKCQLGCFK